MGNCTHSPLKGCPPENLSGHVGNGRGRHHLHQLGKLRLAGFHFFGREVEQALGAELLDAERGHGRTVNHGALHVFEADVVGSRQVADEAAGDTFAGGFIGHLAATDDISFENMKRAVIHGSAMASFCVEKFGTERLLNLSAEEVEAREAQFTELVKVMPAVVVPA